MRPHDPERLEYERLEKIVLVVLGLEAAACVGAIIFIGYVISPTKPDEPAALVTQQVIGILATLAAASVGGIAGKLNSLEGYRRAELKMIQSELSERSQTLERVKEEITKYETLGQIKRPQAAALVREVESSLQEGLRRQQQQALPGTLLMNFGFLILGAILSPLIGPFVSSLFGLK